MTEQEKMKAGLWYDANYNPEILKLRVQADTLLHQYNNLPLSEASKEQKFLTSSCKIRQKTQLFFHHSPSTTASTSTWEKMFSSTPIVT